MSPESPRRTVSGTRSRGVTCTFPWRVLVRTPTAPSALRQYDDVRAATVVGQQVLEHRPVLRRRGSLRDQLSGLALEERHPVAPGRTPLDRGTLDEVLESATYGARGCAVERAQV